MVEVEVEVVLETDVDELDELVLLDDVEDVDVVDVIVVVVEPPQNPGFRGAQAPLPVLKVFCSTWKTHPWRSGPQVPPATSGVHIPVTGLPGEHVSPQVGVTLQ